MNDEVQKLPRYGQVWKHRKGGLYLVLDVLNTFNGGSDKFPVTISYMSLATMERFCRRWDAFRDRFTLTGDSALCSIVELHALTAARELMLVHYTQDMPGGSTQRQAVFQITVEKAIRNAMSAAKVM